MYTHWQMHQTPWDKNALVIRDKKVIAPICIIFVKLQFVLKGLLVLEW